eukprot:965311-Amphidinium_carterae.1
MPPLLSYLTQGREGSGERQRGQLAIESVDSKDPSSEWSSAAPWTAEPGSVGCGVKAQPGPQPPGRAMQSKGGETEQPRPRMRCMKWIGMDSVGLPYTMPRQDRTHSRCPNLRRLGTSQRARGCPGEFNMSYTVDTDPHSIGMDWWGTTYVQIDAASPVVQSAEPVLRLSLVRPGGKLLVALSRGAKL